MYESPYTIYPLYSYNFKNISIGLLENILNSKEMSDQ